MARLTLRPHIFKALDKIEDSTGVMAHELPTLMDKLKQWKDGELKDSYFMEYLNKQLDKIAETE